jgi:tetratricopeptide (TPR) repeat protein
MLIFGHELSSKERNLDYCEAAASTWVLRLSSFIQILKASILCLFLFATGCSHTVSVRSEPPGATLFPIDSTGNRGAPLGVTPVTLNFDTGRDYAALEVTKDGFESSRVVVPLIEASTVSLGVKLKPIDENWFRQRFQKEQSRILSSQFLALLRLQNAILQRNDAEVERLAVSMKQDFNQISAWHSMLGNFHFIKGDRNQAIGFYTKAIELDPDNTEARAMLQALKSSGGN